MKVIIGVFIVLIAIGMFSCFTAILIDAASEVKNKRSSQKSLSGVKHD